MRYYQAKTSSDRNVANGIAHKQPEKEHPSVKILGMETTASCEGGEKWNKPVDILIPVPHAPEPKSPPQVRARWSYNSDYVVLCTLDVL